MCILVCDCLCMCVGVCALASSTPLIISSCNLVRNHVSSTMALLPPHVLTICLKCINLLQNLVSFCLYCVFETCLPFFVFDNDLIL